MLASLRFGVLLASLMGSATLGTPGARLQAVDPPTIELKTVKYPELAKFIRAQKGKVVVVDIWGDFCLPCKKEFPHLVELHKKHADKGLVCVSVAIDEKYTPKALEFLKKVGATFPNFWLDEPGDVWQERWDLKGVPAVFVFDRQGRRYRKFDNDDPDKQFTYADVEPVVQKLLAEKE